MLILIRAKMDAVVHKLNPAARLPLLRSTWFMFHCEIFFFVSFLFLPLFFFTFLTITRRAGLRKKSSSLHWGRARGLQRRSENRFTSSGVDSWRNTLNIFLCCTALDISFSFALTPFRISHVKRWWPHGRLMPTKSKKKSFLYDVETWREDYRLRRKYEASATLRRPQ